jgi:hypothetical protein
MNKIFNKKVFWFLSFCIFVVMVLWRFITGSSFPRDFFLTYPFGAMLCSAAILFFGKYPSIREKNNS